GGQVADVHLPPCPPVLPQSGIIGRSSATYQDMPVDPEPAEFEEVVAGALVAKHPGVVALWIQLAPVPLQAPGLGLMGMRVLQIAYGAVVHPAIQLVKDGRGDRRPEVVGPTPDQRVETPENRRDVLATEPEPGVAQL